MIKRTALAEPDEDAYCVSDWGLNVLRGAGLIDGNTFRAGRLLGYKCECGNVLRHYFGAGGLYVSCHTCKANIILYFTLEDLANHIDKGKVIVLEGDE